MLEREFLLLSIGHKRAARAGDGNQIKHMVENRKGERGRHAL